MILRWQRPVTTPMLGILVRVIILRTERSTPILRILVCTRLRCGHWWWRERVLIGRRAESRLRRGRERPVRCHGHLRPNGSIKFPKETSDLLASDKTLKTEPKKMNPWRENYKKRPVKRKLLHKTIQIKNPRRENCIRGASEGYQKTQKKFRASDDFWRVI